MKKIFILIFLFTIIYTLPYGYIPLEKNSTIHIVSHSHWVFTFHKKKDVGWVQTSFSYFNQVKQILDRLMIFMKKDNNIKFIISEMFLFI
jgi:hypothetical protein